MAFLAVLKEGFETAVFLLAAAETSHGNRWLAVLGGATGIALSVALGAGLYYGGLKLNLGRFFRITGVFLVLIAAGLVLGALRTAHEAGWVTVGQQQVLRPLVRLDTRPVGVGRAGHRHVRDPRRPASRRSAGLVAVFGAGARRVFVAGPACRGAASPAADYWPRLRPHSCLSRHYFAIVVPAGVSAARRPAR